MSSTYIGSSLSVTAIISNAFPVSFFECFGHSVSGRFNHSGPFHQILEPDNWVTVIPRVGKSAGFSFVGAHDHTPPTAVISSTQLATNTPPTRGPWLIHARATVESVQRNSSSILSTSLYSNLSELRSRAPSQAPRSSRRGIVSPSGGASRHFEATRLTVTFPLMSVTRR